MAKAIPALAPPVTWELDGGYVDVLWNHAGGALNLLFGVARMLAVQNLDLIWPISCGLWDRGRNLAAHRFTDDVYEILATNNYQIAVSGTGRCATRLGTTAVASGRDGTTSFCAPPYPDSEEELASRPIWSWATIALEYTTTTGVDGGRLPTLDELVGRTIASMGTPDLVAGFPDYEPPGWSVSDEYGDFLCAAIEVAGILYHEAFHLAGFEHDFLSNPNYLFCMENVYRYLLEYRYQEALGDRCACHVDERAERLVVGTESILKDTILTGDTIPGLTVGNITYGASSWCSH